MTELQGLYSRICEQLEVINEKDAQLDIEIDHQRSEVDVEIPQKIKNLEEQLRELDEYQVRIDKMRILAEKHLSSLNFLTASPRPLNFNRLRNWSMQIDPTSTNDPYAQRVYILCQCNILFLKEKRKEYGEKLEELSKIDTETASKNINRLLKEKEENQEKYRDILRSEDFAKFARLLTEAHTVRMYTALPDKYETVETDADVIPIGAVAKNLPFPAGFRSDISAKIDTKYYSVNTGYIWFPYELAADRETTVIVPFSNSVNTRNVYRGLQNYLFRTVNDSATGNHTVYFMDALHYNTSVLGPLKTLEDTEVLKKLPRNPEQIEEELTEIVASFADMDEILGLVDSVAEYNAGEDTEKKLSRTTLFMVGYPSAFSARAKELVQRILVNQERYGITVVIANPYSENKGIQLNSIPEYILGTAYHIEMAQSGYTIRKGEDGEKTPFIWYALPSVLADSYVSDIREMTKNKAGLGTEYIKRVDMENIPAYRRGKKTLELPFAVDQKDEVHSINFENENFATYLMGASRSGKSTLLHTLITGIIRDYHPDDVELWLVDFKMSEFAQYMDPVPPHVRYILLDESPELVYDIIDKLTAIMMERQQFFMRHKKDGWKKATEVPITEYFPIIFIIMDEFSIMSQAIYDSKSNSSVADYTIKLQNLLAKGAALGIKFIFSSQTFTQGIQGLTGTAKAQIQSRIAMHASKEEITQTLELSGAQKTEQVSSWIDTLPPHYALVKHRVNEDTVDVDRLLVMYFKDNDFTPQTNLINKLNAEMTVSDEYACSSSYTYVNKHPVIVDGNHYDSFSDKFGELNSYLERPEVAAGITGEETFVILGTPRKMTTFAPIVLTPESRQNILLVGRTTEQECVSAVISSALESYRYQGKKTSIWAYGRTRQYRAYEGRWNNYDSYVDLDEVCGAIHELREKIERREESDELIVIMGLDRIVSDFEFCDVPVRTVIKSIPDVQETEEKSTDSKAPERRMVSALAGLKSSAFASADEKPVDVDAMYAAFKKKKEEAADKEQKSETAAGTEIKNKAKSMLSAAMSIFGKMDAEAAESVEDTADESAETAESVNDTETPSEDPASDTEMAEETGITAEPEVVEGELPEVEETEEDGEDPEIAAIDAEADEKLEELKAEVEDEIANIELDLDDEEDEEKAVEEAEEPAEEVTEETEEPAEEAVEETAEPEDAEKPTEEATEESEAPAEEPVAEEVAEEPAEPAEEEPAAEEPEEEPAEEPTVIKSGVKLTLPEGIEPLDLNAVRVTHEGTAYNAAEDLKYIFKNGSRLGYHFMVVLSSYADLKATGIKEDNFNHRIAFQVTAEDSRDLFHNRNAVSLPEHICQYSDTIDQFSFRPYLHEGLSWDGWMVDENGHAVNEFF